MKRTAFLMLVSAGVVFSPAAQAQSAQGEKLSKECNKIYARLCKGVKQGPEMLGQCFEKKPSIQEKIPGKCTGDFQMNIEGYHAVKGGQ